MSKYREIGFEVTAVLDEPENLREMQDRMPGFGFFFDEIEEELVRFTENSHVTFDRRGVLRIRCWGDFKDAKQVLDETIRALINVGRKVRQEPVFIIGREMSSKLSFNGLVDFIQNALSRIVKKGRVRNTIETEIRDGGAMIKITLENLQDWILENPDAISIVRITVWAPHSEIDELSRRIDEAFEG